MLLTSASLFRSVRILAVISFCEISRPTKDGIHGTLTKVFGKQFTEPAMNFADAIDCQPPAILQPAMIDPLLNRDMRPGLKLEITFRFVLTVVIFERSLNVYRMSIVAFNEIGVIAIHRTDQFRERPQQTCR